MSHKYSDLEVVHDYDAPEVVPSQEKVVVPGENEKNSHKIYDGQDEEWSTTGKMLAEPETQDDDEHTKPKRRTCCGMELTRRRIYLLSALAILVVIAAAVGGGVGGTQASRKNNDSSGTPQGQLGRTGYITGNIGPTGGVIGQPSITPTTTITVDVTTSTIDVSPTETAFSDCPSSNGTAYAVNSGSEDSPPLLWRKSCGDSFGTLAPLTIMGEKASSLNDCIRMCVAQNALNATQNEMNPCNTVCWRNGSPGDDRPFHCFGGFKKNDTERFTLTGETRCDSAVWVNQDVGFIGGSSS
ncbi:uncharacterized protein RCC_08336 [Ramularia collo-cygni]|uniref:Apple domain-containing protein n=1 Tax=Ramularia collo-cygni TaxID=112498 RepID=A0A2D3VEZ8_9PEZI|nr:uncharacterized protein RCC_08336 [Ramularia collo-cygni]CZT22631.1 uncharacterized protein RCC_08336 [Ramularia collo-cygni]